MIRKLITAGLLLGTITYIFWFHSPLAAAVEEWTHCHPGQQPHTHSRFASGLPLSDEHQHYVTGDPGVPIVQDGRVTIPAGWFPHDDPQWHNHGDDDAPLESCYTTRSSPTPTTRTTTTTRTTSTSSQPARAPESTRRSRRAQPTATPVPTPTSYPVAVGSINSDGTEITPVGFLRDSVGGQTYALLRRERDDQVVRYWIAPDSALALIVPWGTDRVRDLSTAELRSIPLDHLYPPADLLVQLVDGRVIHWDAHFSMWRHIPDEAEATLLVLGFRWADVTAGDAGFIERITLGIAHPPA